MTTISKIESNAPNDFDFEIGNWTVKHRKLKDVLSEVEEWIEFDGLSSTKKILGGFGNLEENFLNLPNNTFRAIALRSYDSKTKKWSIWWLDGRSPTSLNKPVIGSFNKGIGTFYADEILNGETIKVRFIWDATNKQAPHWQQAFSRDGGHTWQTNWVMKFTPQR